MLWARNSGTGNGIRTHDFLLGKLTSILVVEDDPEIPRLIQFVFTKKGYLVGVAGTGEDALKSLKKSSRKYQSLA